MSIEYLNPEDRYDIEVFNRNFKEIEDKINALEDANPALITPQEVYAETRPSDWLPMPMPEDDEIYLLFHIPDGYSSLLAFTVTCTGQYTVETGTMINGTFVSQTSASKNSGVRYEAELFADDYGNLTSDGQKQAMIRVTGSNITAWRPASHQKTGVANFTNWPIIEIACRLSEGTIVLCGGQGLSALKKLAYFAWYGANKLTSLQSIFQNCSALITVLELDTSKVTSMANAFNACYALRALPELNTDKVTTLSAAFANCALLEGLSVTDTGAVTFFIQTFLGCYALRKLSPINIQSATSCTNMFASCYSLRTVPLTNADSADSLTALTAMFSSCYNLTSIPPISTSEVTDFSNMFNSCRSLRELRELDTSKGTNFSYFVNGCASLIDISLDFSAATNMNYAFQNATALTKISGALRKGTYNSAFSGCTQLSSVKFNPTDTGWAGYALNFANCTLSHKAILELFNSLPTITSAKAISLKYNPGVSELTDTDKAIATQKGWTLTL